MIRVVIFLFIVAALAFGATWLADRPGEVTIVWPWLGRAIDLPLGLVVAGFFVLAGFALLALLVGFWVVMSMSRRGAARRHRAISRGLIAIGAGDLVAARRWAGEARRLAPDEPLALLLGAQAAQLAGNRASAENTFRRMAERDETKLLGLHGLYVEAQRKRDMGTAREVAEAAARVNPAAGWAAQAVLDFRSVAGDWAGALEALDSNMRSGLIDKPAYHRGRAVLLTARALSQGDRVAALAEVSTAVKLAPALVPAAALAGRLLAETGHPRRAGRVIEAAWRVNPHPDLALAYAHVRPGDSARDRLTRLQALAKLAPAGPQAALEANLAVARAAIDAREFAIARTVLLGAVAAPTRRVALLMAEIEERDTGDIGRARQWMGRALNAARDPAWTADGYVSDKWLPVSPVTGRVDAFQWKVPLADLTPPGHVIDEPAPEPMPEPARPAAVPEAPPVAEPAPEPATEVVTAAPAPPTPAPPEPATASAHKASPLPAAPPRREPPRDIPRETDEVVIPLVHSPDDPGPEGDLAAEPTPTPPRQDPWWRGLFR
jgi:HemY protein